MNHRILKCSAGLLACGAVVTAAAWLSGQEVRVEDRANFEVLTRGAVHEGFAEPVVFDPQPGDVAPKVPPQPVEELPPDQRPAGTNVAWIPGYWDWDDERQDFFWISGIWRVLPPGRQWVSGYWTRTADGFQWISGYWAGASVAEIQYLQQPPESLEAGPNVPQPAGDYVWLPGTWIWHEGQYVWRPGYWGRANPDWIWVPAHYVWTPLGCVFVDGYWDLPVLRRGVLFAPIYFTTPVYMAADFYYTPAFAIDLVVLTNHLFCHPRHRHYYFGDYYAGGYRDRGFVPWFAFQSSRRGYDPIFAHERWSHSRRDGDWERRVERDFEHRREREDARPPRTLLAAREQLSRPDRPDAAQLRLAKPLTELVSTRALPTGFQSLNQEERRNIGQRGNEVRRFREERQKLETQAQAPGRPADAAPTAKEPKRLQLPRSPIAARPTDQPTTQDNRPDRTKARVPTPDIGQPTPRVDDDKSKRTVPRAGPRTLPPAQPTPPPQPGPLPRGKAEPRPLPRVEDVVPPNTGRQPGARPDDPRSKTRPEQPRPTPKVEPRQDRQPQATPQPSPRPLPPQTLPQQPQQPQTIPQPRPQPAPKVDVPKPAPKADVPKPAPRVEPPKPAPRVEPPKPAPRVEPPKPPPRVEPPKPAPRVEPPKPAPRVEPPRPAPRVEPPKPPPRVEPPKPPPRAEPPKQPKPPDPPKGGDRPGKGKKDKDK